MMGSPDNDKEAYADEKPSRLVTISRPFYLGQYPVTQDAYEQEMGENPCRYRGKGPLPVETVSWFDSVGFCNRLSQKEGLEPFYEIHGQSVTVPDWRGLGYRLPTEAEWEFACRGGTATRYSFGDETKSLGEYSWFGPNSGTRGQTRAVGTKEANPFGLYDMHGNIWEWCWDWYDENYYGQGPPVDPIGPSQGERRVIRGGCCINTARDVRTAVRSRNVPSSRDPHRGFRVARNEATK